MTEYMGLVELDRIEACVLLNLYGQCCKSQVCTAAQDPKETMK